MNTNDNKKLNRRQLFSYGVAGLGDSGSYSIITSFLLFFLTSVAHLPNVTAGLINTIGGIWDAILSPIMGYISDNSKNKYGRRRPFILMGGIFLLISVSLIFTNINAPSGVKALYYGILIIIFWTSYCTFFIPYLALGAELTNDYDERTHIRMYASTFNLIGTLLGMVMPTLIVAIMVSKGVSGSVSWQIAGYIIAILAFLSIMYTWNETRWFKESVIPKEQSENRSNIFRVAINMLKEYKQVLMLKPMKYLALGSVFYLFVNTIFFSVRMYYVTYNLKLPAATITAVFIYAGCIGIVMIPLSRKLSSILGKQKAFIIAASCGMTGALFFGFTGMESLPSLIIYLFIIGFPTSAYWQLFPSMIYDICEVDEYVYGKRRQGIVVSIQSVAESMSAAITTLIVSIILDLSGFDGTAAVQTQTSENWILYAYTFMPAIFLFLSILMVYLYPLNKNKFNKLKQALTDKKAGKHPDITGLERIL